MNCLANASHSAYCMALFSTVGGTPLSLVRMRVLGHPEVEHADLPVRFRTRKTLALLLYLALEGGRHSRQRLASLLWANSDENHARMALRSFLMHLRSALHEPSNSSLHLLSEGTTVHFVTTHDFDLDLLTVQQAWQFARTLERQRAPLSAQEAERMLECLQYALTLVRGPLCAGFQLPDAPLFEEWLSSQRTTWQLRLHLIYDHLARLLEERGDLSMAQETLLAWSQFDPLHEEAVRRLMQVQQAQGERSAAINTFEHFRQHLWQDLHTRPSSDLTELVKQLRATLTSPTSRATPSALPSPALARLELPLVGRDAEIRQLRACYQRAARAESQVVVLQGEAGIGKTRLVIEVGRWAQTQGAVVLRSQGFERGGRLPYLPIIELLRRTMEQERAPDNLVEDLWLSQLSRLLPELRERYPDLPVPTTDTTVGQSHLFEAVARVLRTWAQRTPLLLVLDDLQWVDTATLDVLSYLLRSWSNEPASILLLLCVRSEELTMAPELATWLTAAQHTFALQRLTLIALSEQSTQTLMSRLQGRIERAPQTGQHAERQQAQLGHWLYRETGGQPFYLLETLKALLDQGVLVWQLDSENNWLLVLSHIEDDEELPRGVLPQSVREVILQRVGRLSMASQRLLQAGAVLGQQMHFAPLCQVAELSEKEGLEALEEVLRSQVMREIGSTRVQGSIHYRFTHDKLREVIYQEAGYARRKRLHQQALRALTENEASAAERAYHAIEAEQWEEALRANMQAGDEAIAIFAVHDAIDCYEQASKIVESTRVSPGALPFTERAQLYDQLGRAYEFVNAWQRARASYESLLSVARASHEPTTECLALNRLALLLSQHDYNFTEILALLDQALQVARQSGDVEGEKLTTHNIQRLQSQHFDSRKGHLSVVAAALQSSDDINENVLATIVKQATSEMDLDELLVVGWKNGFALFDALRAAYARYGNQKLEAYCLNVLAGIKLYNGMPQEALRYAQESRTISLATRSNWGKAVSMGIFLGLALLETGELEAAYHTSREGVTAARSVAQSPVLCSCLHVFGLVCMALLRLEEASAAYQETIAINEQLGGTRFYTELIEGKLCAISGLRGDWAQAREHALSTLALHDYHSSEVLLIIEWTRWYETEALLYAGYIEQAREDAQRFGEQVGTNWRYRIPYLRVQAALATFDGQRARAIEFLGEAARLAEQIGLPVEAWSIQAELGRLYQLAREDALARAAFSRASALINELAAKIQDKKLRRDFVEASLVQDVLRQVG
jgi:DNA-binding SARP family transcriptional activator